MTDNDSPTQSSKKIDIRDFSGHEPGTAPELDGPVEGKSTEEADVSNDVETTTEEMGTNPGADPKTDKAVDDIMKKDGDEMLEAQDAVAQQAAVAKASRGRFERVMRALWGSPRKRWSTIAVLVVVIAAVFGVPYTRYNILGLVLSSNVTVHAVDSKTGKPVSGAKVALAGKTAETNAEGVATLHVHTGSRTVQVTKSYYKGTTQSQLVALSGNNYKAALLALGRQVSIKVLNQITGKPVAGATISSNGASTKTNASGLATLIVASSATTQEANVMVNGYNTAKATVTAGGDLAKNTFNVVPAGKLYFLSNLSGSLDVVKTNLDGTERATVLAGTGNEDKYNTSLLASRDWKYLALLSKRADKASVYLIDTTNGDKLTTIDEGDAIFSLIGWSGDRFVYQVTRNAVQNWQPNRQALKSFDPTDGHTLLLDQTQGLGNSGNFLYQTFSATYLLGDQVAYTKSWQGTGDTLLNGKSDELDTIGADGSGHKVVKTFTPVSYPFNYGSPSFSLESRIYEPGGLYIGFYDAFYQSGQRTFYTYEDGKVTSSNDITDENFYQTPYPTHLQSPSGNSTLWTEVRDGKNALFTGDANGKNAKQVAAPGDYSVYGWFTEDYLLVSKSGSELYIAPTTGGTPLKITDYYRPTVSYEGYGGGYGGL